MQAYLDAIEGTSDNTDVDASAGRAVLARQAAIAEQTISRGQLHRDASGFERMPLEKTRLEVFVEGNPALEFLYRGIKAREVAGVRCAWCDKTFDSVDMSDGRLFTMIHEHVTKSNFHDHLRRHGGGLLALYNRETGPAPATGGFESDLTTLCFGLHVQEIIIGGVTGES